MYYSFYLNEQMLVENWDYYKDANWLLRDCLERDVTRTPEEKADYYLKHRKINPNNDWMREYFKSEEFKQLQEQYEQQMLDIEMERECSEDGMYYGRVPNKPRIVQTYEDMQGSSRRKSLRKRFEYQAAKNAKRGRKLRQINEVILYKSDIEFIKAETEKNRYTLKQIKILFGAVFFSRMHDVKWTRLGTEWKRKQFEACYDFTIRGDKEHNDYKAVNEVFEHYTDWKENTDRINVRTKWYYNIGETEFDWIYPNFDNKDEIAYIFKTTLENNRLDLGKLAEEVLPDIREKYCDRCGISFNPSSNRQKYCEECKQEIKREQAAERKRRQRNREKSYKTEKIKI